MHEFEGVVDALQLSTQMGRLDFLSALLGSISALLAVFALMLGLFGLLGYGHIRWQSGKIAAEIAREEAARIAREDAAKVAREEAAKVAREEAKKVAREAALNEAKRFMSERFDDGFMEKVIQTAVRNSEGSGDVIADAIARATLSVMEEASE